MHGNNSLIYFLTDSLAAYTEDFRLLVRENPTVVAMNGVNKLKIYPSLVKNTLTIEFDAANHEAKDFYIVNLLGQQVMSGKVAQRIDVSALSQGTYVFKIGTEQAKFIKQ